VCGTVEAGYNADIDMREYKWRSGTYKILLGEPFARFEAGRRCDADKAGFVKGRWGMDDDLDHDLEKLLEWIKKYGYHHITAAEHKTYDAKQAEEKAEAQYKYFKKSHYDRLKKEFLGE
jgi:hypothetical protein